MTKHKPPRLIIPTGRYSMAAAVASMLANEGWKDGPGGKARRDPDRALEERDERARMENEFELIWEGDV